MVERNNKNDWEKQTTHQRDQNSLASEPVRRGWVVGESGCAAHRSRVSYLVLAFADRQAAGRTSTAAGSLVAVVDIDQAAAAVVAGAGRNRGSGRAVEEVGHMRRTAAR